MMFLQPLTDTNTRIGRQILQLSLTTCTQDKQAKPERNPRDNIVNVIPLLYNKIQDVRKDASQHLEQFFVAGRIWDCQVNVSNVADFLVSSVNDNKHERWFTNRSHNHEKPADVIIYLY